MKRSHASPPPFTVIEHTADTGFEVAGKTLAQLFENAGLVLLHLLWPGPAAPGEPGDLPVPIRVSGQDPGELLVSFLEEFLYLQDARELVCTGLTVDKADSGSISATAWGHPFQPGRDEAGLVVKAVTYHQLKVEQTAEGWVARVILDI
jgi:SHS2 domain-containing protein